MEKPQKYKRKLPMKSFGSELCGFLQVVKSDGAVKILLDGKPIEEQLDVRRLDGEIVTVRIDVHDIDEEPAVYMAA